MINIDQFRDRVTALWDSQKRMAGARKWKSGRRAGQIRSQAIPILFTKRDLEQWLWADFGFNARPCPYCNTPIDILSLTLDHVVPRSAGGEFSMPNLEAICAACNSRKGNMTKDGFIALLNFIQRSLSGYDQGILLGRLKDANSGSASRFFRDKKGQQERPATKPQLPAPRPAHQPDLWF